MVIFGQFVYFLFILVIHVFGYNRIGEGQVTRENPRGSGLGDKFDFRIDIFSFITFLIIILC